MRRDDYRAGSLRSIAAGVVSATVLAATLWAMAAPPAQAAEWPTRPVTVIVPYAAGGNTDTMARLVSKYLSDKLGQPFVVENRPGGSGTIATGQVARATLDGYTLLFGAATQIIIMPILQKLTYDPDKDLVPVSVFGAGPYILGVTSSLPARSFQEFIAYAKANPGKLNYGSAGTGGIVHLATALFASCAGIDMVHVPYRSGAPALSGLIAGEVDLYFGNGSELMQQASNPRIRLLATSATQRLAQHPDMPTIAETYPGFRMTSWNGFLAPAGTPQPIVDRLAADTAAAARDPMIAERLMSLGIVPDGGTPDEMAAIIRSEKVFYRDAVTAAGVKIE
jgi:tripartite-type tricarboxylate transporter receptor subunit TctC